MGIFLLFNSAIGQEKKIPKYHFEPLKNIPTQRAVATISQDKQGFIWMGTNGLGLNRYNGADYVSYQSKESDSTSLSSSLVHTTYVDRQNHLWIGTEAGLDLYNREQNNFQHIRLPGALPENSVSVQAIIGNKAGEILVGTHQYGFYKIDPSTLKASQIPIRGIEEVRNFLINSIAIFDGRVLIGTKIGLFEYHEEDNIITPFSFTTSRGKENINVHIKTMMVDSKGTIWLGTTSNGLYKIDRNENGRYLIEHFSITSKRILSLLETPRKTILCGTENDGIFELGRDGKILNHYLNNKFDRKAIRSSSIWSLFMDNQERIWIGYYNNGVDIYDQFYDKFGEIESKPNNRNSLQSSSVSGLLKDEKGRLWIGMDGGGIDVYDPATGNFTHLLNNENSIARGLDSPDVQTLFRDSKGNIWVGTWDYGIYFLKKGSHEFKNYSVENTGGAIATNRILSFSEASNGIIWIGTFSRGVHSFDPETGEFTIYDQEPFWAKRISYSDVRRVYVDSEDNIWIGGNEGLFKLKVLDKRFNLESMSSRFYSNGNRTYNSLVLDIYEDSSKNLWIGTDGAGLCRYDMKTGTFDWVDAATGFNKVTVSSIIEDEEGFIWAAGNNGLSKLTKGGKLLRNFTSNDGLLSDDFNNAAAYKDGNGTLYFGSYEGVDYFSPGNLSMNKNTPTVYLTNLKIFNQVVAPGDKDSPLQKVISQTKQITLNHNQSVFSIDYASIDFTRPGKIRYAYYLEGFENSWNYVQNTRSATYTNLPAGKYTFKVKAANSDGVWNEQPTTLNIKILRPWWLTNLAIALYVMVFIILIYFSYRFVASRIRARRAIQQERERHLQEEALNDKKIQFFTNISHEFRTPLTLIMSPLQDILKEPLLPESLTGKLQIINKNTVRLKHLIDELMDFRKLQLDNIDLQVSSFNVAALFTEIQQYFREEAHQRNIFLSLEIDENIDLIWADKNKLEKILFNILSNAFKSTNNNGIITVEVSEIKEHNFNLIDAANPLKAIKISIEDTGKGIHPDEIGKIFTRFYQIKERNEQYYSGTGIGLEVVKSFVELHRGDLEVESEIGVGTKFSIFLPSDKEQYNSSNIVQSTAVDKSSSEAQVQESTTPENKESHKKILLIVEDNVELRTYLKEELSSEYRIIVAENGREGLEQAKKYLPDIAITDVIMPEMNGYEFCSRLKEDLSISHIPILMLTAKAMAEDWVEGLEAGADVYLNKPFDMKIMRSHLKQLVKNRALLFSKYMGGFNKPEAEEGNSTSLDQQFISDVMRYIRENIRETNLNVEKLAEEFNLSRSQLYRKIKALTGYTANEVIRKVRLERARELLEESEASSVSEISYNVGFSSPSYFSKCFKAYFGILPKEVKEE